MKLPRLLSALCLAALTLPSSGCFLFSDDVEPIYEIDEDDFVVVKPLHDPDFPRSAWDSPTGHDIAMRTTRLLDLNGEFNVVNYGKVLELMYAPPVDPDEEKKDGDSKDTRDDPDASDDVGLDVRKLSEKELADLVGADYVLVCKILRFRTKDPKNINMVQGTAIVECNLFRLARTEEEEEAVEEVNEREKRIQKARELAGLGPSELIAAGGKFVARAVVNAKFPDDYLNSMGEIFLEETVVRDKLMDKVAEKISKLLYEHEPDDTPGSGS